MLATQNGAQTQRGGHRGERARPVPLGETTQGRRPEGQRQPHLGVSPSLSPVRLGFSVHTRSEQTGRDVVGGGRLAGARHARQELGRSVSTQGFHYVYRWAERETHVYLYRWAHLSWLRAARAWELSPSHSTPVPASCFLNILPPEGDWTAACPQRCPKGGWEWVCG